MYFRVIDDDEFERLSIRQRVDYLAQAINALETLMLQIYRQLGDMSEHELEQARRSLNVRH